MLRITFLSLLVGAAFWLFGPFRDSFRAIANPAAHQRSSTSNPDNMTMSAPDSDEGWIIDDYAKAAALARSQRRPLFIDFTGYTIVNSRWMETNMFNRADVAPLMNRYVRLRLYCDGRAPIHERNRQMQKERFGTIALPFYAILSPTDTVITTFAGMTRDSSTFVRFLEKGLVADSIGSQ